MKFILALIAAFIIAAPASASGWFEGSTIGVRTDNVKEPGGLFLNSAGTVPYTKGGWTRVHVDDLVSGQASEKIPTDTKSIFLTGVLLITHAGAPGSGYCDMRVNFRAPGDTISGANYHGQVIEAHPGGGQRSPYATWVPVVDGEFEIFWDGVGSPGCYYGLNMTMQAYVR